MSPPTASLSQNSDGELILTSHILGLLVGTKKN